LKDLNLIGRDLEHTIIIDNTPEVYKLHRDNAIPIPSWFDDVRDDCLIRLIPLLEQLSEVGDVRHFIPKIKIGDYLTHYSIHHFWHESSFEWEYRQSSSLGLHHHVHYKWREELMRGSNNYYSTPIKPRYEGTPVKIVYSA